MQQRNCVKQKIYKILQYVLRDHCSQQQNLVARGLRDSCIGLQTCDVFEQPTPGHRVSALDHRLAAALNAGQRWSPPCNATYTGNRPRNYKNIL